MIEHCLTSRIVDSSRCSGMVCSWGGSALRGAPISGLDWEGSGPIPCLSLFRVHSSSFLLRSRTGTACSFRTFDLTEGFEQPSGSLPPSRGLVRRSSYFQTRGFDWLSSMVAPRGGILTASNLALSNHSSVQMAPPGVHQHRV